MNAEVRDLREQIEANWPDNLPRPTGFRLLVALPSVKTQSDGGIALAEQTIENERVSAICGHVISMGQDAYQDEKRFPNGPWCEVGDWILMRPYAGTRFKVDGVEYRMLNDDSVEGVVADPRGVVRV